MPQDRDCQIGYDNGDHHPADGTFDIVESTTATGTLTYPETRGLTACATCIGSRIGELVKEGTFLSVRQSARLAS